MTSPPLARRGPAPPVRLGHLGLGSFFRAHAAWYTAHAPDARAYGYAAFTGRSPALADALTAQGGCYTLVTRGPEADAFEVVGALAVAAAGDDHERWRALWRDPDLCALTVTVTEAGHCVGPGGRLLDDAAVAGDVATLRADPEGPARTAPGRILAGLAARSRAGGPPVALVACDNLPRNGEVLAGAVAQLAARVDPRRWDELAGLLAPVTTVVDRITPAAGAADRRLVADATGVDDAVPVITEPYTEWVLAGAFPAGRPGWEAAGARFVADASPFAQRKLLLLNGGHSLLAYAGSLLGHRRTPDAVADDRCRSWLDEWWDEAAAHLGRGTGRPAADAGSGTAAAPGRPATGDDSGALGHAALRAYRVALLGRFANHRLGDRLARIAEDGSQKLPVRVVPVLAAARAAGELPAGAVRIVAAWLCHLDGYGAPVRDVAATRLVPLARGHDATAARRILAELAPGLADDAALVAAVADEAAALAALAGSPGPGTGG